MTWLSEIEALRPGEACEFKFPARRSWHRATVLRNGGSGYWEIQVAETFDDITNEGDLYGVVAKGTVTQLYIEHVRCVGQTEAWPR